MSENHDGSHEIHTKALTLSPPSGISSPEQQVAHKFNFHSLENTMDNLKMIP